MAGALRASPHVSPSCSFLAAETLWTTLVSVQWRREGSGRRIAERSITVPITHTNAKGQTFTLYQVTTKTGKPKYYFAMQSEETLTKAIPAGYEIYENPNA